MTLISTLRLGEPVSASGLTTSIAEEILEDMSEGWTWAYEYYTFVYDKNTKPGGRVLNRRAKGYVTRMNRPVPKE